MLGIRKKSPIHISEILYAMQTNPQMQTPNLIYDFSPSEILVGGSCYNMMSDENRNVLGLEDSIQQQSDGKRMAPRDPFVYGHTL